MTQETQPTEPPPSQEQVFVLLPCPFCGGDAKRSHHDYAENGEEVVITCDSCYAEMRVSDPFDGECEGNWNERESDVYHEAFKKTIERLTAMTNERKSFADNAFANGDDETGHRVMAVHSGYVVASLVLFEELQNAKLGQ